METVELSRTIYNQWYVDEGKGRTVLLLHGLFGNLKMWSSTVEALKANYRVIIPRLPLFDLPSDHTNLPFLVEVLHEFIKEHNLDDVIIVAHGMGSQLALLYAHQHPGFVDRLVISGSTGFVFGSHSITESEEEFDYDFIEEKVQTAFYQPDLVSKRLVDHVLSTVQPVSNRVAIDALIGSANRTRVFFLNKIEHPVLLLWGLEDKITVPDVAMHFHDYLRNSVVHFIDKCGHVPMLEQPEDYNWHLTQFIKA